MGAAYLKQLRLDRKTRELIFIVRFTSMRASKRHIHNHIHAALDLSVSKEKYWRMKISFTKTGIVAFREGFEANGR